MLALPGTGCYFLILVPVGCYSQMAEANGTQTITQTCYKGKYSAQRVYMTFGSGGVVREGFPLEVKESFIYTRQMNNM